MSDRPTRLPYAVALLTLVLSAPFAASAGEASLPRLVSVTGEGEVKARPDIANVTLGVEARRPTLAEARTQVTAAVDRLLALTRELRIDPKQVDASQLHVQPEYRWNEKDSERVLLGYVVSRQVEVELRDLERLGALLERAVSAGANQVQGVRLDSSRRKELEREALAVAVRDARLDAEALASAAGAKLGAVHSLDAAAAPPVQPKYMERAVMAAAPMDSAEQTYATGDMRFTATVHARYELAPGP
jgi:uncharacterized protein